MKKSLLMFVGSLFIGSLSYGYGAKLVNGTNFWAKFHVEYVGPKKDVETYVAPNSSYTDPGAKVFTAFNASNRTRVWVWLDPVNQPTSIEQATDFFKDFWSEKNWLPVYDDSTWVANPDQNWYLGLRQETDGEVKFYVARGK